MRILLVVSLFFILAQAAQNRLVIGTFSSEQNANNAKEQLQAYIAEDENFNLFVTTNKLQTAVVPHGKFFITTLEPFGDEVLERFALSKLIVHYDGTYSLQIGSQRKIESDGITPPANPTVHKTQKIIIDTQEEIYIQEPLLEEEPSLEELAVDEDILTQTHDVIASQKKKEDIVTQPSQTTMPNKQEVNSNKESSVLGEFIYEIIAFAAILVAAIAYFIIRYTKYFKREREPLKTLEFYYETEETKKVERTQVEATPQEEIAQEEMFQEPQPEESETSQTFIMTPQAHETVHIEDFGGSEEGSFGVEESPEVALAQEPTPETGKSRRKKREVPPHAKITKQNFKEFAGMRILVAEDNLINQKVISGLLADSGIELVIADDGKEALDILKKDSDFTLILMDAHMPRIDGFEATKQIRANPAYEHILVVALSGDTAADDIKKMQAAGMEEHLEKPLKMDSLYDILYAYSDGKESQSSDEYIEVIMTNELHGDEGLNICGGDEEFYKEILNEFVTTYSDSAEKIHAYLAISQMSQADKLLLDIVGITSNIGAKNLNSIAKNLKDALADTQEKSYLTLADEYEKHLHYLLRDIKAYNQ